MDISHRHKDDLESMFASFASIPKISSDPEKEKKVKDKKAEKETG